MNPWDRHVQTAALLSLALITGACIGILIVIALGWLP